ncbi:MAG TPA: hypothetical protein VG454_07845 [Gemmatimonadales bacterium]|nr:hypothetical protein [Gemmatimonadales bacterium]
MTSAPNAVVTCTLAMLAVGCSGGHWQSRRADKPLSRAELSSRNLSILDQTGDPCLRAAFALALARQGFTLVPHASYHEDLEVTLRITPTPAGTLATGTLRSDGFFVDEASFLVDGIDDTAGALARTLAVSERTAEFVRNSGTPQQRNATGH